MIFSSGKQHVQQRGKNADTSVEYSFLVRSIISPEQKHQAMRQSSPPSLSLQHRHSLDHFDHLNSTPPSRRLGGGESFLCCRSPHPLCLSSLLGAVHGCSNCLRDVSPPERLCHWRWSSAGLWNRVNSSVLSPPHALSTRLPLCLNRERSSQRGTLASWDT